jgi:hypothetical protein
LAWLVQLLVVLLCVALAVQQVGAALVRARLVEEHRQGAATRTVTCSAAAPQRCTCGDAPAAMLRHRAQTAAREAAV